MRRQGCHARGEAAAVGDQAAGAVAALLRPPIVNVEVGIAAVVVKRMLVVTRGCPATK